MLLACSPKLPCTCIALITLGLPGLSGWAQVEPAKDGPAPMSPQESLRSFDLRDGFAMTLIASEPLIQEPSGVCWDEAARLYVSELHGYNLEGQYDIEALNETGQLDRTVRRIQADEVAKKKALKGIYGVIKRLRDSNGDGTMDEAMVFADGLPPCFGMVAARGGIIVAACPHIMYLKDSDEDGVADVRAILFTGFEEGVFGAAHQCSRNGAWIIGFMSVEEDAPTTLPVPIFMELSIWDARTFGFEPTAAPSSWSKETLPPSVIPSRQKGTD